MVYDGLRRSNMRVGNFNANGSVTGVNTTMTGSITGVDTTMTGSIVGGIVSNTNGLISSSAAGSPSTFGQLVQAGTGSLASTGSVWVVFGTAFASTPESVVANYVDGTVASVGIKALNAGSVDFEGETVSKNISWIAVGTK